MPSETPLRLAFLGCGFITGVHSRRLRALRADVVPLYASRERAKADDYSRRFGGAGSYGDYEAAIDDPAIDAVVVSTSISCCARSRPASMCLSKSPPS